MKVGIAENEIVILSVGRLTDRDKMDYLAMLVPIARLIHSLPKEPLTFIFSGEDSEGISRAILEVARQLGIHEHVRVLPNVDFKTRDLLYESADVFISLADNIQETFGLTLVEAMSRSLPVVVSDWGGYRDIVKDGSTGFLVPTSWGGCFEDLDSAACLNRSPQEACYQLARRTVVDLEAFENAVRKLIQFPDLRRKMGADAFKAVKEHYDWKAVMRKQDELFSELTKIKEGSQKGEKPVRPPHRGHDLGNVFGHYPTFTVNRKWKIFPCSSLNVPPFVNPIITRSDSLTSKHLETLLTLVNDSPSISVCCARAQESMGLSSESTVNLLLSAAKYGLVSLGQPLTAKE
jgi:hypothetical protein